MKYLKVLVLLVLRQLRNCRMCFTFLAIHRSVHKKRFVEGPPPPLAPCRSCYWGMVPGPNCVFEGSIGDLVLVSDSVTCVDPEDVLLYTASNMSSICAALHTAICSLDGLVRRSFGVCSCLCNTLNRTRISALIINHLFLWSLLVL